MRGVTGWDIGGVNTKAARVAGGRIVASASLPYEIQHAPEHLAAVLAELAARVGSAPADRHAVTITAELSQAFRTKGEGIATVTHAVESAFPGAVIRVLGTDGGFHDPAAARAAPLVVAAANWMATALAVARLEPDAILVDMGTTTTDVIPIAGGAVHALGRTDPDRLASGELVYTGLLRTPVEAIVRELPWRGGLAGVAADGFAIAGDAHLWLGALAPADYTVRAPDGRPAARAFAGERLARTICADGTMLDEAGVTRLAEAIATAQRAQVAGAIRRVAGRWPATRRAVVTGLGESLAAAAARDAGLAPVALRDRWGDASRIAPAAAVALLLDREEP